LTNRSREREALDEVLHEYMTPDELRIAKACLFIAGAPLHVKAQRERMLALGQLLLEGAHRD
jgi:hypothetical protein